MTNSERRHLSRVSELGCALCKRLGYPDVPAEIHHLREGAGMAQRQSNFIVIPLCPLHHRQKHGIHGDRQAFKDARIDEMDLLADVLAEILG